MGKANVNSPDCCNRAQVRSSGRIIKRPRRDLTPPPSPPKKDVRRCPQYPGEKKKAKEKTPESKPLVRKAWEQWTTQETKIFFEAVNEHGRDFDAIHQHFVHKFKKSTEIHKSKEQIRFFYYRTAKKVSKCITNCDDINKQVLEVYSLINYGEFRKKGVIKLDERLGQKLNELVHSGTTVLKIKGKNVRLKTPVCKALLKIHQIEDNKDVEEHREVKLPAYITVEMYPRNSQAWTAVQELSQNPRIRIKVKPGRRLSSLFGFLQTKWKPEQLRAKEKLEAAETSASKGCSKELNIQAVDGCHFSYYEMKPPPPQPKRLVSMDCYLQHIKSVTSSPPAVPQGKRKGEELESLPLPPPPCLPSVLLEGEAVAMHADMMQPPKEDLDATLTEEKTQLPDMVTQSNGLTETEVVPEPEEEKPDVNGIMLSEDVQGENGTGADPVKSAVAAAMPLQRTKLQKDNVFILYGTKQNKTKLKSKAQDTNANTVSGTAETNTNTDKNKSPWRVKLDEKITLLKEGVNKLASEQLLIGELYLLMGSPDKVNLVYEWVEQKQLPDILGNMSNMLRRLLHVAAAEYSECKKPNAMHELLLDSNTANKEVQVNTLTVKDVLATAGPRGASPAITGRRTSTSSNPSTPKSRLRINNPSTPTTPTSSLIRSDMLSPTCSVTSNPASPLPGAVSVVPAQLPPGTIRPIAPFQPVVSGVEISPIPSAVSPASSQPRPIAPSPLPPESSSPRPILVPGVGEPGMFKIPTAVPMVRTLQPKPMQQEPPIRFEPFPRRRRQRARHRTMVLSKRNIVPKDTGPASLMHFTILPAPSVIPNPSHDLSVLGPPPPSAISHPSVVNQEPVKRQATVTVLDPMHFSMKAKCRRIIPTPVGAVTGDKELNPAVQTVIEDSAQDTSSLQNVKVSAMQPVIKDSIQDSVSRQNVNLSTISTVVKDSSLDTVVSLQNITTTLMQPTVIKNITQDSNSIGIVNGATSTVNTNVTDSMQNVVSLPTLQPKDNIYTDVGSLLRGAGICTESTLTTSTSVITTSSQIIQTTNSSSQDSISGFSSLLRMNSEVAKNSILDISLPPAPEVDQSTEKLIDLALENSTQSFSGISGLLEQNTSDMPSASKAQQLSPPAQKGGKASLGAEYQWLNGEDFNLSSFLDTCSKDGSKRIGGGDGSSRDATKFDVDSTLQCMMNESSIDYMSKFADLVKEVTSTTGVEETKSTS